MMRLAALMVALLCTGQAQALSCSRVPLLDEINGIAKALTTGRSDTTIGIGTIGKPQTPVCSHTDWSGNTTCTATQAFSGVLYTADGPQEVTDTTVRATFYEHALTIPPDDVFAFWKSWPEGRHVFFFYAGAKAEPTLVHLDTCGISILGPATEELTTALHACLTEGRCRGAARRHLEGAP